MDRIARRLRRSQRVSDTPVLVLLIASGLSLVVWMRVVPPSVGSFFFDFGAQQGNAYFRCGTSGLPKPAPTVALGLATSFHPSPLPTWSWTRKSLVADWKVFVLLPLVYPTTLAALTSLFLRRRVRAVRLAADACPSCGYDLGRATIAVCPDCGAARGRSQNPRTEVCGSDGSGDSVDLEVAQD